MLSKELNKDRLKSWTKTYLLAALISWLDCPYMVWRWLSPSRADLYDALIWYTEMSICWRAKHHSTMDETPESNLPVVVTSSLLYLIGYAITLDDTLESNLPLTLAFSLLYVIVHTISSTKYVLVVNIHYQLFYATRPYIVLLIGPIMSLVSCHRHMFDCGVSTYLFGKEYFNLFILFITYLLIGI